MSNLRWESHIISKEVPEQLHLLKCDLKLKSGVGSSHIPPQWTLVVLCMGANRVQWPHFAGDLPSERHNEETMLVPTLLRWIVRLFTGQGKFFFSDFYMSIEKSWLNLQNHFLFKDEIYVWWIIWSIVLHGRILKTNQSILLVRHLFY